ncbi:uncharacterized protein GGS25DRAFT_192998 [Hypoxylon fragiforme]|uniref:uncharacterized protein n=1 Tax=Hypoxylon fragiforme TaxID=63214 RepID=UPI0020C6C841|nr:uncharacterized protein GGS25DRAFT_192998 [Hypoxylon fragiforme]KAI2611372.1 hypothetical protein GGS25DRAFT_192998 [Hypoxylon fragiforme]
MSRYEDGYSRSRSSRHRDRSPEYAYEADNFPTSYEESRQLAKQEDKTYNGAHPLKQLTYESETSSYPRPPSNLLIPESHARPRSLPDKYRRSVRGRRKERGHSKDSDYDESDDSRERTPLDKARGFVDNTFSNSTAGLGVGVLGALVGGLAAREAVDATSKHNGYQNDAELKRNQMIGTVVGAAVGALGANAVEKRLEVHREKDKIKQEKWERRYRPESDVIERREVIMRPRSTSGNGSGWKRDYSPWEDRDRERLRDRDYDRDRDHDRSRNRGVEREVDPDARSWRNVEDWLYDDRNDTRPKSNGRKLIEDDEYRY